MGNERSGLSGSPKSGCTRLVCHFSFFLFMIAGCPMALTNATKVPEGQPDGTTGGQYTQATGGRAGQGEDELCVTGMLPGDHDTDADVIAALVQDSDNDGRTDGDELAVGIDPFEPLYGLHKHDDDGNGAPDLLGNDDNQDWQGRG